MIPEELNIADYSYFVISSKSVNTNPTILNFYLQNKKYASVVNFRMVGEVEIQKAFSNIKSEAFQTDGIGLRMLFYSCPCVIPIILQLVNCCIEIPQPKELKDLRPISILPTMSKIMARILEAPKCDLFFYLLKILLNVQSGFRKDYSYTAALMIFLEQLIVAILLH